jgi:hypothetical protein
MMASGHEKDSVLSWSKGILSTSDPLVVHCPGELKVGIRATTVTCPAAGSIMRE